MRITQGRLQRGRFVTIDLATKPYSDLEFGKPLLFGTGGPINGSEYFKRYWEESFRLPNTVEDFGPFPESINE